jgi:murein DD-endopeptidase MepM/ murein hydrolase activator NlpD
MSSSRRIATVLAVMTTTVALVPTSIAHAAAPAPMSRLAASSSMTGYTRITFATKADLALDSSTTAQPGEGVIRITTRVCGNANNWQAVAAANNIAAPVYLVLLGQKLTVACTGGTPAPAAAPPAPAAAPVSSGWADPAPGVCVTSGYGMRWGRMHQGVDLALGYGAAIHAAAGGTVQSTSWSDGGGNMTVISHGNNLFTVYMHQSSRNVGQGQRVNAGDVIGHAGATGDAQGPHLHFEVQPSGVWGDRVDPVPFMRARGINLGC